MKRPIAWILAGLVAGLALSGAGAAAAAGYDVATHCTVAGLHYVFGGSARAPQVAGGKPAGFICAGTAYAPIRFVATSLGQAVGWDGSSDTITLTAAGSPAAAATKVVVFKPEHFTATQTVSGSCWTGSIAAPRAGAYRCMTGNAILDPCFTGAGQGEVACPDPTSDPDRQEGTVLRLTKPLPATASATGQPDPRQPWRFTLTDGASCGAMTGTILPGHPYGCAPAPSPSQGTSSTGAGGSSAGLYCTAPAPEAGTNPPAGRYFVRCAPLSATPAANGAPQLGGPSVYAVAEMWL